MKPIHQKQLRASLENAWEEAKPRPFDPKNPIVRLHEPTYGVDEIWDSLEVLLSTRVTMGEKVRDFEARFARSVGARHAIMVNSGSSANLLALAALTNPAFRRPLKPGDEVIVPALSWSTTVWPIIQTNLVPVVVDVDPFTFNIDLARVRAAIGPRTRAIMPVHVYGNPCDMDGLRDLCDEKNLLLVEDACEATGAQYDGRPVSTFGAVGTFSFYFSHHITTLEGGMCVTNDDDLADLIRILRAHGWIRDLPEKRRPAYEHPGIDPRFLFVNLGYNMRATELQGAFGLHQLSKLEGFVEQRRDNAAYWKRRLEPASEILRMQKETPKGRHAWFGLPLVVPPKAPFDARNLTAHLNARGIETRSLIAGNIAAQPGLKRFPHRVPASLPEADHLMKAGFSVGNHQLVDSRARTYVADCIEEFLTLAPARAPAPKRRRQSVVPS